MGKSTALVEPTLKGGKLVIPDAFHEKRTNEIAGDIAQIKQQMTPELIKKADEIGKAIDTWGTSQLRKYWQLGKDLDEMGTDPVKYGPDPLGMIAAYLRCGPEILQKSLRFHTIIHDQAEIDFILTLRQKLTGRALGWQYIDLVLKEPKSEMRMQLLQAAADNDWTPAEMDAEYRALVPQHATPHAGGRPLKVPSTYTARLENLDKVVHVMNRNHRDMWTHKKYGFLQTAEDVPVDKLPKVIGLLDKEATQLETAIENMTQLHKELKKARATAADKLSRNTTDDIEQDGTPVKGKKRQTPKRVATVED